MTTPPARSPETRRERIDRRWALALRLIRDGASRREAARFAGLNHQLVYLRLRRIQDAHGFPPIPDAPRGRRRKVAPVPSANSPIPGPRCAS